MGILQLIGIVMCVLVGWHLIKVFGRERNKYDEFSFKTTIHDKFYYLDPDVGKGDTFHIHGKVLGFMGNGSIKISQICNATNLTKDIKYQSEHDIPEDLREKLLYELETEWRSKYCRHLDFH